ncbi:MAG: polyribonucleotide nucleotidyltransferase, partial [Myxococcota bacterium]
MLHNVNEVTRSVEIGGKTITFSTGKYAKQANGAVMVSCGESQVHVTAVCADGYRTFDFLPLTVDYSDRAAASGTIPGGFFKREGRSGERETLVSRLIDRPIRPLFPKHFRKELQVIANTVSYDKDNETDVLAFNGAAAAFHISNAPLQEAAAAVRVCRVDGELKLNPGFADRKASDIDLIVAGTMSAITMVEGGANEASEQAMLDVLDLAHENIKKIIETLNEFRGAAGKPKMDVPAPAEINEAALKYFAKSAPKLIRKNLQVKDKHERKAAMKAARDGLVEKFVASKKGLDEDQAAALTKDAKTAWEGQIKAVMRGDVIKTGKRLDGRATDEIRDIWVETGVAIRAHGSAVFTRGETQALVSVALGTDVDSQRLDLPTGKEERHYMFTYVFEPYCTGEARPLRGPKRREVGHGALARRALLPVLPNKADFPYVYRCTSEVLESNGSSSMASACGASLALMDAGVPLTAPVAGIA